jgi:hypothetical protein
MLLHRARMSRATSQVLRTSLTCGVTSLASPRSALQRWLTLARSRASMPTPPTRRRCHRSPLPRFCPPRSCSAARASAWACSRLRFVLPVAWARMIMNALASETSPAVISRRLCARFCWAEPAFFSVELLPPPPLLLLLALPPPPLLDCLRAALARGTAAAAPGAALAQGGARRGPRNRAASSTICGPKRYQSSHSQADHERHSHSEPCLWDGWSLRGGLAALTDRAPHTGLAVVDSARSPFALMPVLSYVRRRTAYGLYLDLRSKTKKS